MSERTLRTIFGALGVLVALWLASTLLSGPGGAGSGPDRGVSSLLDDLDATTVSAVRIAGPTETVSLQRTGDAWTVNGHPADSAVVARFWSGVTEAEVGGVAAINPKNHDRMGVSADSARTVHFTLADGGTASLLVGKGGPIFPSGYVRLPDENAVVVVSGDLRPIVILGLTEWRDKTILRVDTAAVVRIVWETSEGTHVAERSDSTWSVDGGPANTNTIRTVLTEFTNLVATGFVEEGDVYQESGKRVIALGAAGDTLGTVAITGEGTPRHARTPGNAVVFEIPSFRAERIAPDIESLRETIAGGV